MRPLWTLFKVIVALAIVIPLGFLALALTMGVVGTALALAMMALRLAVVVFVGYGLYRLGRALLGAPSKKRTPAVRTLPAPDPYYDAALRELDSELRGRP